MDGMSKSPEEIKKDLAAWGTGVRIDIGCGEFVPPTPEYMLNSVRSADVCRDALALIQQLEAQNAELVKKAEYMEQVYVQMMKYLRGLCNACMHYGTPSNKAPCSHCKSARGFGEMWEWRGVQEQPKQEGENDV